MINERMKKIKRIYEMLNFLDVPLDDLVDAKMEYCGSEDQEHIIVAHVKGARSEALDILFSEMKRKNLSAQDIVEFENSLRRGSGYAWEHCKVHPLIRPENFLKKSKKIGCVQVVKQYMALPDNVDLDMDELFHEEAPLPAVASGSLYNTYCTNCGTLLLDEQIFCPYCGTKRREETEKNSDYEGKKSTEILENSDAEYDENLYRKDLTNRIKMDCAEVAFGVGILVLLPGFEPHLGDNGETISSIAIIYATYIIIVNLLGLGRSIKKRNKYNSIRSIASHETALLVAENLDKHGGCGGCIVFVLAVTIAAVIASFM